MLVVHRVRAGAQIHRQQQSAIREFDQPGVVRHRFGIRAKIELRFVNPPTSAIVHRTGDVNLVRFRRHERDEERAQEVALLAIDLGAEDFELDGSYLEARCAPEQFEDLRGALEARGVIFSNAELDMSPKSTVRIDEKTAEQTLRLLDRLEDLEDVQKVFSNADFPDEVLDRLSSAV